MLLAAVILAAGPIPSSAITFKRSKKFGITGSVTQSSSIPSSSQIFGDNDELLAKIAVASSTWYLCSFSLTSLTR